VLYVGFTSYFYLRMVLSILHLDSLWNPVRIQRQRLYGRFRFDDKRSYCIGFIIYIGNFCLSFFPFRCVVFSFNCAPDCFSAS